MPISPSIPEPESDYLAPVDMLLSREVWDAVFASVGQRLRELEAQRTDLQETIDYLTEQALTVISASITDEIDARRADLVALEAQFLAVSDAYIELISGGVYADGIQMRTPLSGTVQAAVVAMQLQLANMKKITVASLFFGAS
jgi:ribosomal protein S6E (S10)